VGYRSGVGYRSTRVIDLVWVIDLACVIDLVWVIDLACVIDLV
jgi:hypothetical protein